MPSGPCCTVMDDGGSGASCDEGHGVVVVAYGGRLRN